VGVAVGRGIMVGVGVGAGLQPESKRPARARRARKVGFLIFDLRAMSANVLRTYEATRRVVWAERSIAVRPLLYAPVRVGARVSEWRAREGMPFDFFSL